MILGHLIAQPHTSTMGSAWKLISHPTSKPNWTGLPPSSDAKALVREAVERLVNYDE